MSKQEALSVAIYYHRRILEESCALEDLGKAGAFVKMARPMPVGSPLVIRFRDDDKGVGPALPCTVTHVEEISSRDKTGRSGVQIAFVQLEQDREVFLAAVIEGTAPGQAGADFPEEPDFLLPEPPIPGEASGPLTEEKTEEPKQAAVEPASTHETGQEPGSKSEAASPDPGQETQEAQSHTEEAEPPQPAPQDPPAKGDDGLTAGEIGGIAHEQAPETDLAPKEEQPSVVVESAVVQQMTQRAVSGEIGSREPLPVPQEEPSVVVGELEVEMKSEAETDETSDESSSDTKQEQPAGAEEDKPKKKKRRRGRRKKKTK